jgi:hypothetical protein
MAEGQLEIAARYPRQADLSQQSVRRYRRRRRVTSNPENDLSMILLVVALISQKKARRVGDPDLSHLKEGLLAIRHIDFPSARCRLGMKRQGFV